MYYKHFKTLLACVLLAGNISQAQELKGTSLNVTGNGKLTGDLNFGTAGALLRNDQGGSIELGGNDASLNGGVPYIDFHSANRAEDYNIRLINSSDRNLELYGALTIKPIAGTYPSSKTLLNVLGDFQLTNSGKFIMNGEGQVQIDANGFHGGRLTILPSNLGGNMGIGTNNPVAKLHVQGLTLLGPDPGAELMGQLNNCASVPVDNVVPPLRLFANGTIGCLELRVNPPSWCDYVFNKDYKLKDLKEVESYIEANHHLPEVPSEKEVKEQGVYVSEMLRTHMRKIEELTLYMIEQNKKIEALSKDNEKLTAELSVLKNAVELQK